MFLKAFLRKSLLLSLLIVAGTLDGQAQKLTPEEIIAKDVASLGAAKLLTQSRNLMAIAGCEFVMHIPERQIPGRAVLASDGSSLAFFSKFNSDDYPMERIGIFGDKVKIPPVKLGGRSPLGGFLKSWDKTLASRIFGGAIFSTWRFLSATATPGTFATEGMKKIDNRGVWILSFTPKGGLTGGSYIKLYFDAKTFHHVRTVHRQKEPERGGIDVEPTSPLRSGGGVGNWNADLANNSFTLTEDFDDIRSDLSLMLPHKYSISVLFDGTNGTAERDWNLRIEEYRLIREFPADFFTFGGQ